jgi:hypothetical protein
MTQETRASLDLTFTGQAVLKQVKDGKSIRLLAFRVRGQNMNPPAELVLSLKPLPLSLKILAPEERYIDNKEWVHYVMKAEALEAHPGLFSQTDAPDYLDKNLDVLLDLTYYELLLPASLTSA